MESASESIEPLPDSVIEPDEGFAPRIPPNRPLPAWHARAEARRRWREAAAALQRARFAILVYLGSRAVLMLLAAVEGPLRNRPFLNELANWDGLWYRWIANHGYPTHVLHVQSRLGFFPLYPLVTRGASRVVMLFGAPSSIWAVTLAGVIVSSIGGLVASVLIERLAAGWWGSAAGRRAVVLFCLFPGSVVFSMVYAEGIMIPFVVGCLLALQQRRWLMAGILAGLATASEPEGLVLVLVCGASAARELNRAGWRAPGARKALIAPVLSLTGIAAVAIFFWTWAGSPFASLIAQRDGWHQRTNPLALWDLAKRLVSQISFTHFNHPTINLNLVLGLVGAIFLLVVLVLLFKVRRLVSVEALVWTAGISFLAITSEYTPPNPRLLITAFPVVIVLAHYLKRRAFALAALINGGLLIGLSALTFVGVTLRP